MFHNENETGQNRPLVKFWSSGRLSIGAPYPPQAANRVSQPEWRAPMFGAFAGPSDGLEPETPSLPCAPKPLPWVATGCQSAYLNHFRGFCFATGCHRLRPLGSINAPCPLGKTLMTKGFPGPPSALATAVSPCL